MGADTPDWGGQYSDQQFYPLFDMAELAVRLGSPVIADRRGNVVYLETFDHGLGGIDTLITGTGSAVNLVATPVGVPPFSVAMVNGTSNPSSIVVRRRHPIPFSKNVGFSAMFRLIEGLSKAYLEFAFQDGTTYYYTRFGVDIANETLFVYVGAGVQVDIVDPFSVPGYDSLFSFIKLVIDIEAHQLVRGIFNGEEYDLSAYAMVSTSATQAEQIITDVVTLNTGGVQKIVYLDSMIGTASEPDNA